MQTIFELKNKEPYDLNVLEKMQTTAAELLRKTGSGQNTQAVVVHSATGGEYSTVLRNACSLCPSGEDDLLDALKAAGDTEIRYVLCVWQDGGIDIPSYAFRKMLTALDPKNTEARLFVMTAGGISAVKVSTTMK